MKFLLILAPLFLCGVLLSVRPGGVESEKPGETGHDGEIADRSEKGIPREPETPVLSSPNEFDEIDLDESAMLSEFTSSEQFANQEYDFPEREFPDAPLYYSTANAPE